MSSFFEIKVTGLDESILNLLRMEQAEKDIIPIMENSYKRYQIAAFRRAPIKTGMLKSTLVDDRFTVTKYTDGSYKISQRQGTYNPTTKKAHGAYYLLLQEFTHKSKSRFVRDSIIEERPKLQRELEGILSKYSR